jgi:phage FluMu gp28-like protein
MFFLRYNVIRCCMDQTGMGEKPVEDAKAAMDACEWRGCCLRTPTKLTMATQGKEAFEDRRIRIPLGDKDIRADCTS